MSKPQLVLLPGAWHIPEHYATLVSKLESHGYTVHISQLPSVGSSSPPSDLSEDIATTRALVEKAIGYGNDVIVLPHSWAGIVAGSALVGMSKKEREVDGKKGGVTRTGYIAAFIIEEGKSLIDSVPQPEPWWDVQVLLLLRN